MKRANYLALFLIKGYYMKDLIATWITTLDHVPQYFNWDTGAFEDPTLTKNRILNFIDLEEKEIRTKLKKSYGANLSLNQLDCLTYCLTTCSAGALEFTFNLTHIVNKSFFTKVYKVKFTSASAFVVTPDGEAPVVGATTTDTELQRITIKKEMWTGYTFANNDTLYLSISHHEAALISLVSKAAAAKILEQTFSSQTANASADAAVLRRDIKDKLDALTSLSGDERLEIAFIPRNIDIMESSYEVDAYGNNVSL
jgi:hypothetical protein